MSLSICSALRVSSSNFLIMLLGFRAKALFYGIREASKGGTEKS